MQITDPSQIKDGMKVFYVHSFPQYRGIENFIRAYRIIGKPYAPRNFPASMESLFVYAFDVKLRRPTYFSLKDCNVIPNNYNDHRLYDNEEEAYQYAHGGGVAA